MAPPSDPQPNDGGPLFTGRIIGHRDGFGFLKPDAGGDDVFIPPREMLKAMHGDRVQARVVGTDRRGRPEAVIVEVLELGNRCLVGRLVHERNLVMVAPEDQRIKHDIIIASGEAGKAQPGEVVMVEILEPPTRYTPPMGRVVEILGNIEDPGMEVQIAVRKFDVPHRFSAQAAQLAKKLPAEVRPADVRGRVDLRDVPLVTIDGEDARDFDDAVYAEPYGRGGWRLLVAIADVSHYVKAGDAIDRDAYQRATSVYFPREVIPMLPESLSNGLCSLNPAVDRLCMVCDMVISATGTVKAYQFYEAVMHSAARLTYDMAWSALANPLGPEARQLGPLNPCLEHLRGVYETLLGHRHQRGAIELETVETAMQTDAQGRIVRILPRIRNEAHRIIEECMLAANTSAADFLLREKLEGLYRVHEGPTPERLNTLRDFLKTQGLRLGGGEAPQPSDYAQLAAQIRERPDARLLQTLLLRSMQQAIYTPDNSGHFGLAYSAYTHFTSPIRRYPDLLVHRAIKARLHGKRFVPEFGQDPTPSPLAVGMSQEDTIHERWRVLGDHCSAAERRADEASRDVEAWLKCQFMKDRVGEQFEGTITGVAPFGVFVTLDTLYVEGLIHVSELGTEYFQHNEVTHELRGERTGRRFRLYDSIRVLVSRVDLDARRIEFRLVLSGAPRSVKKSRQAESNEDVAMADVGLVGAELEFPAAKTSQPAKSPKARSAKVKSTAAKSMASKSTKGKPATDKSATAKSAKAKAVKPKAAKSAKPAKASRKGKSNAKRRSGAGA